MGQWGKVCVFEGMNVLPHVKTDAFAPIQMDSIIDKVYVLDAVEIVEEYAMRKKFVGMTYEEYLRTNHEVCPTCKREL